MTDDTGTKIFDEGRSITQAEVDNAVPVSFGVGNKYLIDSGTQMFSRFTGISMRGNATMPYFVSRIHPFDQVQLGGHVEHVTTTQTIFIGCEYSVAGGSVLIVPVDFKDSFTVTDSNSSWDYSNPCIVDFSAFGVGLATLQDANQMYEFSHNGSAWTILNLRTGKRELV